MNANKKFGATDKNDKTDKIMDYVLVLGNFCAGASWFRSFRFHITSDPNSTTQENFLFDTSFIGP